MLKHSPKIGEKEIRRPHRAGALLYVVEPLHHLFMSRPRLDKISYPQKKRIWGCTTRRMAYTSDIGSNASDISKAPHYVWGLCFYFTAFASVLEHRCAHVNKLVLIVSRLLCARDLYFICNASGSDVLC